MPVKDSRYQHFERLKMMVRQQAEDRLGIRKPFEEWSGNDIADFRVDLEAQCNSSISEKWFYTHLKNESEKLPRIDVLHLLSQYIGYKNWDHFMGEFIENLDKSHRSIVWFLVPIGVLLVGWAAYTVIQMPASTVHLTFIDAYTKEKVNMHELKITDKAGHILQPKLGSEWSMAVLDSSVVDGPYYKPAVIDLSTRASAQITLFPDDYAMMLNFFSRSTTEDWERRRSQLMNAIHPEAKIFQSHPQYSGIELLNREEFIYRLTLPINSLRNLDIQDIVYKDEKIYRLRFTQTPVDHD